MNKRIIVVAIVVIVLALAIAYVRGPAPVPPGQPPLVALSKSNLVDFEKAFDAASDSPRLLLLFSPT